MNTFKANLVNEDGKYYVEAFGAKILVDGEKGEELAKRDIKGQEIILGVRPEHIVLDDKLGAHSIETTLEVNEMMGSELHLHVNTTSNDKLIVRVPTINLTNSQRNSLVFGSKVYITFEGKVMHFFDKDTKENLLK